MRENPPYRSSVWTRAWRHAVNRHTTARCRRRTLIARKPLRSHGGTLARVTYGEDNIAGARRSTAYRSEATSSITSDTHTNGIRSCSRLRPKNRPRERLSMMSGTVEARSAVGVTRPRPAKRERVSAAADSSSAGVGAGSGTAVGFCFCSACSLIVFFSLRTITQVDGQASLYLVCRLISSFRMSRALCSRDLTVPSGSPVTCMISS